MRKIYLTILLALTFAGIYAQCPVQVQQVNVTCFGLCNGSAQAFGSGGGPYTYQWTTTPTQTTQTATGLCAGTYSVIVINGSNCTGTATVTITQPSQVTVVTTGQNPNSCTNCNGLVVASATGGTPGYTYMWTPGNCLGASCGNLCAGTYTCTVTDANGCTGTSTWTLTGPAGPSFGVSSTPANNPNCDNGTGTVTVGTGTFTYLWSPTSQTTQTATGLSVGIYTVCVTNAQNGCTACQLCTVTCTPSGIVSYETSLGVNIYPNPASNHFTIEFTGEKTGEMNLEVYNIVGEVMFTQHINVAKQLNKQIDVSTYPKGIYFVRIKGTEGTQTMKLIVN